MSTSMPCEENGGRRPVTGRTVLGWMIGFFAVIFAANAALIWLALDSFPGVEVSSAYRAGQEFNGEVDAAAAQAARGWNVAVHAERDGGVVRLVATFADRAGEPERNLEVAAALEHPTDSRHDRRAVLAETTPGVYMAEMADVGPGRWNLMLDAGTAGERLFRSRNQIALAR